MFKLKKVNIKEILSLVKEADEEKTFLPSISDGSFSIQKFFTENNKQISLYGSYSNNNLVGFLSILSGADNIVSIGPMYISKNFRGFGLGEKQIKTIINVLKREKIKGIKTKTWGKNIGSRKIFENLGFRLIEEKPNTRINGDSTVKYYLELI